MATTDATRPAADQTEATPEFDCLPRPAPTFFISSDIVLLIGGAGVLIACVALIVLVLRALLTQAVAREAQANELQAELNEVI